MDSNNSSEICTFQIGKCRIIVDLERTKQFYATLPKITDNCNCGYCEYFEKKVVNKISRLFEVLKRMQVDLTRQPNINPDGIYCVGETKPNKLGYFGYYFIYGSIGKTSKKTASVDSEGNIGKIEFNDREFGTDVRVTITKIDPKKLVFEFYMEVDK